MNIFCVEDRFYPVMNNSYISMRSSLVLTSSKIFKSHACAYYHRDFDSIVDI